MKRSIWFESPFPGSLADGYIGDDLVTFELISAVPEVCGSGESEFWGSRVFHTYTVHHVETAKVKAVNDEPYDTSIHGAEEIFLGSINLRIQA